MNKPACKEPEGLIKKSILGAGGEPIQPEEGIVVGPSERAGALNFGTYIGYVPTTGLHRCRVYYASQKSTYNASLRSYDWKESRRYVEGLITRANHRIISIDPMQVKSILQYQAK